MDPFTVEAWTYLAIDLVVVFGRFGARWKATGFRGLAPDDFLMVLAVLLYTAETATAHYVGAWWMGLANSGMTDEQRKELHPGSQEWHLRTEGSKTQLFGWLVYTVLLWTLKTCWLFFYKRLGTGVDNMPLKINLGFFFVAITFLGTFFTILCGCWPISKHWQINPDPGNFCQPAVSRLQAWTLIVTNLTTDFYIMSIPIPMIWSARLSGIKKVGLLVMFCGGIITAVFGGLRCGFVLQDSVNGPQLAGEWSCRESFVAVFIGNVPILFPILRGYWVQAKDGITRSMGGTTTSGSHSENRGRGFMGISLKTISSEGKKKKFKHPLSLPGETLYEEFGSEENMVGEGRQTKPSNKVSDNVTVERRT